jgi:hypothetical protein
MLDVVTVSDAPVAVGVEVAAAVGLAGATVSAADSGVSAVVDATGVESPVPPQATVSRPSVVKTVNARTRCFLITTIEPTTSPRSGLAGEWPRV